MNETTKTAPPEKADAAAKPAFWAVLPAAVRYNDELPPNAKLLYAEISALTDQRGYCYASNEYFMRLYNLSERTIRRLISELARLGYVSIADGDGGRERRKIYAGVNPLLGNPDKNDRVPGQNLPGSPDKNVPHNKKDNKKANNPPKAPQGAGADYVPKTAPDWKPKRFDSFWKFYPLHKSKQATIRAWDKLKPSDELLAVIGRALKRQIAEKEQHGDPWKLHASTYLNQARWTDETEPAAPTAQAPGEEAEVWL